jgi:hypothetical protein
MLPPAGHGAPVIRAATRSESSEVRMRVRTAVPSRAVLPSALLVAALALGVGCQTQRGALGPGWPPATDVSVGDAVESRLDEDSRRNLKDGSPSEAWLLWAESGTPAEIRAESEDFDTYLTVFGPDGELLAVNDDAGPETTDSRLRLRLHHDRHLLVVSGFSAADRGTYRLIVEPVDVVGSGARLGVPGALEGILDAGSAHHPERRTPFDRFVLEIDEPTGVVIDMSSEDLDAYLVLTDESGRILAENDDAGPGTLDARVVTGLEPGFYEIHATSFSEGATGFYRLEVASVTLADGGPLELPAAGILGLIRPDDPVHPETGTAHHAYAVAIDRPGYFVARMQADDLNGRLLILDAGGRVIATSERAAESGEVAVRAPVEAGPHTLVVTTQKAHERGVYTLFALRADIGHGARIAVGEGPRTGVLAAGASSWTVPDRHAEILVLEVEAPAAVQIDLSSEAFDTYLVITREDEETVLAENDDATMETTDSQLRLRLAPGRYGVIVTSYAPLEAGPYTLEVSEVADAPDLVPVEP